MKHEDRMRFKHALMKLIDNHQEEFEALSKQKVYQVNHTADNQVFQVLFDEHDAVEIKLRSIVENEIVVR